MKVLNGTVPVQLGHSVRRHAVPVMYVHGTHYDVGYDIGRTFGSMIKNFIRSCDRLRQFTEEYYTERGRDAYELTLKNMRTRFPQYIHEMEGIAEGAEVPFHQLFLLQMDDVIETINENCVDHNSSGCSSVGINNMSTSVLGHTEDAFAETLNHFYIVRAHIVPTAADKAKGAVEEKFMSLCYAGHLPGYTMGCNLTNMVFSINTLSPERLVPGRSLRTFITRALLTAQSIEDVERIVRDKGLGAANGCSINVMFISRESRNKTLHNVEMAPNPDAAESILAIRQYKNDPECLIHCNKYMQLQISEVSGPIIDSSNYRLSILTKFSQPQSKKDVINMLSDIKGEKYRVFQDLPAAVVKTIAVGVFDLDENTWSIYTGRPNESEPEAVLPLFVSNDPRAARA